MRDVSRMNYNPDPDFRPDTPDVLRGGAAPAKRTMPEIYPYAYRKLLELQVSLSLSLSLSLGLGWTLGGYISILVVSCIPRRSALDSSGILLS